MRAISGKELKYRDSLARRRRWRVLAKFLGLFLFLTLLAGGTTYLLFFSPVFEVRDISVNGLEDEQRVAVTAHIRRLMDERMWRFLQPNKNILFLDTGSIADKFLAEWPFIKSAAAEKNLFHAIQFDFVQRGAMGVWCFRDACAYFDEDGKTWGTAARSSGFLLLTVQDMRSGVRSDVDPEILAAVKVIAGTAPELGIRIKGIQIPADFFNEVTVSTNKGFVLQMSLDSDISGQLRILSALLEKKRDDKNFGPSVIDLRIDGRIYYK